MKELEKKRLIERERYEKLHEILVDGALNSDSEILKPLKKLIDSITEGLEGERKNAEIEAQNEPFRLYNAQVRKLWDETAFGGHHSESQVIAFQCALETYRETTLKLFPNLQLPETEVNKLSSNFPRRPK